MKTWSWIPLTLLVLLLGACRTQPKTEETQNLPVLHEWAKNAIIYEVNVRQYTPEGTLQAFKAHLPRLAEMGVDILWLMPVHPIGELNRKGSLGSYYAVKDYTAVNPEFGTLEDLKLVVAEAHQLGMKVILDWVANHSAWDNPWATTHPDFYEKDSSGQFLSPYDWTDVISFDYNNAEMRDSMLSALKYWLTAADIDGYRCDVAGMVPLDFWEHARMELNKIKPVFMLAEDEDNVDLMNTAFEMNYGWNFHHHMNQIAKGEKTAADLWTYLDWNKERFSDTAFRMYFVTNHDENSWNGTIHERLGPAVDAFTVLSWTLPGMPLIYSGEESGETKRLRFFDKDTIDWSNQDRLAFYLKLNKLRTENPALWSGFYGGEVQPFGLKDNPHLMSFFREKDKDKVVVILNLSGETQQLKTGDLQTDESYENYFTGEVMTWKGIREVDLDPWAYQVWIRK